MKRLALISFYCLIGINTFGHIITSMPFKAYGAGQATSTYIGILDQSVLYNKDAYGAFFDDGVFVAVPSSSGRYNGYNYYQLGFKLIGAKDGGPAYLPTNPGDFKTKPIPTEYRKTAHHHPDISGYFTDWGRGTIPFLPNYCVLPKGTLFFFWISGGGDFNLPFEMIQPIKQKALVVRSKTIPSTEEALWFDESEISTASYTIIENIQKPISAPPPTVKPITAATPTITPIVTPQPIATPCFKCRPKPPKPKGNPRR